MTTNIVTKTTLTAAALLAARRAYLRADGARMEARPAHYSRAQWRAEHPVTAAAITVIDLARKSRPRRVIPMPDNGQAYDLWIWGDVRLVERIDLRAPDADARLARYRLVENHE